VGEHGAWADLGSDPEARPRMAEVLKAGGIAMPDADGAT